MCVARLVCVYSGSSHSFKLQRLSEATEYNFSIQAVSSAGRGPLSPRYSFSTTRSLPPQLKGTHTHTHTHTHVLHTLHTTHYTLHTYALTHTHTLDTNTRLHSQLYSVLHCHTQNHTGSKLCMTEPNRTTYGPHTVRSIPGSASVKIHSV